jgi:hypothetical protein
MSRARDRADGVLHNRTHEDTDGGRESLITFKGEQSGGEISTLAQIQASHDGTADDQKADLIFRTNDGSDGSSPTPAVIIDSLQNVGLGQNPVGYSTALSALQIGGNANIVAEKTGAASNSLILSHNANYDTDSSWEYIVTDEATSYYQSNGLHVFRRAASGTAGTDITWTEMARINQYGLAFNGDTTEANSLDDYEEGSWNPTVVASGGSTGQAYSSAIGHYVKVGRMVNVWFHVQLTNEGTPTGSNILISGLPYAQNSGTGVAGGSINYASNLGANVFGSLTLNASGGTTQLYLNHGESDSTGPISNSINILANTSRFDGFATYITA